MCLDSAVIAVEGLDRNSNFISHPPNNLGVSLIFIRCAWVLNGLCKLLFKAGFLGLWKSPMHNE